MRVAIYLQGISNLVVDPVLLCYGRYAALSVIPHWQHTLTARSVVEAETKTAALRMNIFSGIAMMIAAASASDPPLSALDAFLTALAELNYDAIPQAADDPVQDLSWMWQYCSEYGEHLLYSQFCFGADERRLLPAWRPRQPAVHRDVVPLAGALPAAVQ